jgi:hypothetical protein
MFRLFIPDRRSPMLGEMMRELASRDTPTIEIHNSKSGSDESPIQYRALDG